MTVGSDDGTEEGSDVGLLDGKGEGSAVGIPLGVDICRTVGD